MKVTLKELCWLLRDERRGLTELQQQFAKAKATWETERAELKGHATQVSLPGHFCLVPSAEPTAARSGAGCPGHLLEHRSPPFTRHLERTEARLGSSSTGS